VQPEPPSQRGTPDDDARSFRGSPFEELFRNNPNLRRFFEPMPEEPQVRETTSLGSGVIIDPEGIILTNNHVVAGADEIRVTLANGEVYEAKDIKTDRKTDLAVVWIDPKTSVPSARLGNSSSLEVGDWVVAIGSPFGLEQTVSAGIISAKGRSLGATFREDFLQTDAAINVGNSGGPLVDMNGEVVGINTAITSGTGQYAGVGFAIPADMARWVSDQLIAAGKVQRSYLGVAIQPMTSELADEFELNVNQGVLVSNVNKGTPAEKAGLKPGDVVLSFAGIEVNSSIGLQRAVETQEVGSTQSMVVLRDGKRLTLKVTLEEQPEQYGLATRYQNYYTPDTSALPGLGIDVLDLTPELAKQLGYDHEEGVVIRNVEAGSAASRAGLQPGMLVLEADGERVTSPDQFREIVDRAAEKDGKILLRVMTRDGAARYLRLRLG
jgi:serine protease Do